MATPNQPTQAYFVPPPNPNTPRRASTFSGHDTPPKPTYVAPPSSGFSSNWMQDIFTASNYTVPQVQSIAQGANTSKSYKLPRRFPAQPDVSDLLSSLEDLPFKEKVEWLKEHGEAFSAMINGLLPDLSRNDKPWLFLNRVWQPIGEWLDKSLLGQEGFFNKAQAFIYQILMSPLAAPIEKPAAEFTQGFMNDVVQKSILDVGRVAGDVIWDVPGGIYQGFLSALTGQPAKLVDVLPGASELAKINPERKEAYENLDATPGGQYFSDLYLTALTLAMGGALEQAAFHFVPPAIAAVKPVVSNAVKSLGPTAIGAWWINRALRGSISGISEQLKDTSKDIVTAINGATPTYVPPAVNNTIQVPAVEPTAPPEINVEVPQPVPIDLTPLLDMFTDQNAEMASLMEQLLAGLATGLGRGLGQQIVNVAWPTSTAPKEYGGGASFAKPTTVLTRKKKKKKKKKVINKLSSQKTIQTRTRKR